MTRYLVAAALVLGFSSQALAVETYYIMFDCKVMTTKPSGGKLQDDGRLQVTGRGRAMKKMKECG